jgi:hypothetical protein
MNRKQMHQAASELRRWFKKWGAGPYLYMPQVVLGKDVFFEVTPLTGDIRVEVREYPRELTTMTYDTGFEMQPHVVLYEDK